MKREFRKLTTIALESHRKAPILIVYVRPVEEVSNVDELCLIKNLTAHSKVYFSLFVVQDWLCYRYLGSQ